MRGYRDAQIGLVVGVFAISAMLLKFIGGHLADSRSARVAVLIAVFLSPTRFSTLAKAATVSYKGCHLPNAHVRPGGAS
jgi:nitrate/nitrite transporter NarK